MGKVSKSFRFETDLYEAFKRVINVDGCTVTRAFERFMAGCVESGCLVFAERGVGGFEAEARVLVDWLRKDKRSYRGEGGEEVNVAGRLVWLLTKVHDDTLRGEMEAVLKRSVSEG